MTKTQERKLNYKTGDVVNLDTSLDINFDGSNSQTVRAQVISVKPNYTPFGRDYTGKFLSYEPIFASNSEIVISGNVTDINLYIQYAGAPSQALTLTFVFDGAVGSGSATLIPAIRNGAFPVGSVVNIILANGAFLQGKGGSGGRGATYPGNPRDGGGGGVVFNADGVTTNIYFSGATPSANYPTANGYLHAPSGGDGGFDYTNPAFEAFIGGDGGRGGNGRNVGIGGTGGSSTGGGSAPGDNGANGVSTGGSLTAWGADGADNDATGGLAGSGIKDDGATVTLFGSLTTRYVNGNGDH
jgi:hypothetical protein